MKNIKVIVSILLVLTIFSSMNICYGGLVDDIFNKGNSWLKPNASSETEKLGTSIANFITGDVVELMTDIGNLIFFIVAAFLGVKYIWSGVSGKSEVKETLPTFVIGAMFFYSSSTIVNFSKAQFIDLTNGTTYNDIFGSIWTTVTIIVQILAIAGIIAIGLKYMFSTANTKADIKKDLLPMAIGLIVIYSSTELIPFIVRISEQLFKP